MAEETVPVPVEDEKMEETAAPSTSAEQVEGAEDLDNEAKKLMGAGSRHMVMKDIRSAVNAFQEASSVLGKKYGETADECADAFFSYGMALLELARMENGVLGNALEGMPEDEEEDGEKEEDPNIPSAANLDEKEREQLREQVYDAMAEQEKPEKSEEPKTEGKEGNGDVDMEECDKPSEDKGTEERTNGETPASSSEKVDETKKGAAAVTETEKASVAEEKGAAAVTEVKGSAVTETEKGAVAGGKGAVTEEKGAAAVTETEKGAEEKGAVVTESEKGAAVTEEKDAAMDETEKGAVTEEKDAAVVAETGKGAAAEEKGAAVVAETGKGAAAEEKGAAVVAETGKGASVTEKGAAGKAEESMDESKGEEKDTDASKSEETEATEKAEEKTEDSSKPPAQEADSSKTSAVSEPPSQASEEAKPAAKETEGAKPPAEETASKEPDVKDAKVEGEEEAEPMEGEEGEDGESEESEENEGTDEKENDEEEVGNLQLAWEMLDLSKVIFKRQQTKEAQLKAAQAHLKLGEVSIESENYGQAIEDFLSCLNIQKEHLEKHDRLLAETHYQLGLAYQYSSKHDSAISHFTQSTEVIEKRVAVLTEQLEKAAGESTEELQKEMDELKGLLPDIREKIEDSKEAQKTSEVTEKALKETLAGGSSGFSQENGSTSSSAPPAPAEKSADSTVPVTNCVSDISHLVRKKRKPEEESPLKEAKKAKAEPLENGSGNGDAVVPTKEEVEKTEEAEKQTPMETPMETTAVESSA